MSKIFAELKLSGKLPTPSGVGLAILKLTQKDDYTVEEVVGIIKSDPSLTAQLIQVANHGGSSSGSSVTTLDEAVMRVGFGTLRSVALGFSLISSKQGSICPKFDYPLFWSRSLGRAVSGQVFSQHLGLGNTSEAYVTGLLASIGELALATLHSDTYGDLLEAQAAAPELFITRLETDRYGINHHELSEAMLREWGFPHVIAQAVGAYAFLNHQGRRSDTEDFLSKIRLLRTMDIASSMLVQDDKTTRSDLDEFKSLLLQLGVEEPVIPQLFETIKQTWIGWGKTLNIQTGKVRTLEEISANARDANAPDQSPLKVLTTSLPTGTREEIERTLCDSGMEVLTAADCQEALEMVVNQSPQVLVFGENSKVEDAASCIKSLRRAEVGRFVYSIMITRNHDDESIVKLLESGVDDFMISPASPRVLAAKVRSGRRVVDLQKTVADDQVRMQKQVAELAILNRKLQHASLTDALTQLPNRRSAMEQLAACWETARQSNTPFSVVMADIDHFKKVNDQYGHTVGDEVLSTVGRVMRQCIRSRDMIFRLGGEEFLMICPETDLKGGIVTAERVRRAIEATRIQMDETARNVTISLGVACYEKVLGRVEDLVSRADEAAYRSKANGRNRVSFHGRIS